MGTNQSTNNNRQNELPPPPTITPPDIPEQSFLLKLDKWSPSFLQSLLHGDISSKLFIVVAHISIRNKLSKYINIEQTSFEIASFYEEKSYMHLFDQPDEVTIIANDIEVKVNPARLNIIRCCCLINITSEIFAKTFRIGKVNNEMPRSKCQYASFSFDELTSTKTYLEKHYGVHTPLQPCLFPDNFPEDCFFKILSFNTVSEWSKVGLTNKKTANLCERTVWPYFYNLLTGTSEKYIDGSYVQNCSHLSIQSVSNGKKDLPTSVALAIRIVPEEYNRLDATDIQQAFMYNITSAPFVPDSYEPPRIFVGATMKK
jgi:hypothetical protein